MSVQVTFLGAGDAFNARGRCHASYMVQGSGGRVLLDCGATTMLALKREGLTSNDIDAVFVSHLHGDHFGGIPFLLLENVYEVPRDRPFVIVGPPETKARVLELYSVLYRELAKRGLPFELQVHELQPGASVKVAGMEGHAFEVPHQEHAISFGFRIAADGKSVLYSGDTGWTEALVEQSQGTDLFICECCYFGTSVCFHLDYPTIRDNRHRFGCKRMVLTHIGREVHARRAEIDMEIADDGLKIDLG